MNQKSIHGRVLHVRIKSGQSLKNLAEETSSQLVITEGYIEGTGSEALTNKNHPVKKSWKVSASMLFSLTDFYLLYSQILRGEVSDLHFGNYSGGYRYSGYAFPVRLRLQSSTHSLIKCQIEWQGTGALTKTSV